MGSFTEATCDCVFNLYKMLNVREGFERADDAYPEVWLKPLRTPDGEQAPTNSLGTRRIGGEDIERLLDDYYDERGWDARTGKPSAGKLRELGLDGIDGDPRREVNP